MRLKIGLVYSFQRGGGARLAEERLNEVARKTPELNERVALRGDGGSGINLHQDRVHPLTSQVCVEPAGGSKERSPGRWSMTGRF
mmetsp:Transcript_15067/g.30596  ORF Transcript_15067/g.30596 Transcript_15067/m.30596 type:complete len:85 (+) Transcript_15067:146-400(+)